MTTIPAIRELVPHETPILALDALTDWQLGHATARLTIRPDNAFLRQGHVDTVVTLEYMAQCVAACLGMEAYVEGGTVRVGMVIACRKMEILRPTLQLGEVLTIKADCVRGTDSISHYDGEVRDQQGDLIATSTMTLVHGEKPPDS